MDLFDPLLSVPLSDVTALADYGEGQGFAAVRRSYCPRSTRPVFALSQTGTLTVARWVRPPIGGANGGRDSLSVVEVTSRSINRIGRGVYRWRAANA